MRLKLCTMSPAYLSCLYETPHNVCRVEITSMLINTRCRCKGPYSDAIIQIQITWWYQVERRLGLPLTLSEGVSRPLTDLFWITCLTLSCVCVYLQVIAQDREALLSQSNWGKMVQKVSQFGIRTGTFNCSNDHRWEAGPSSNTFSFSSGHTDTWSTLIYSAEDVLLFVFLCFYMFFVNK